MAEPKDQTEEITARRCTIEDFPFVHDLSRENMKEFVDRHWGGWNELLFWTDIKPLNITILERGGERVGFFDIHREEEVLRLRNIQLRRDFHGRGVGRWMLERVEEEALRTGARR
jgi:GNAT superfamily N-acetyltransferase